MQNKNRTSNKNTEYQRIIRSPYWQELITDCYEDYLEELDADWQPSNIQVLSKSDWLKTDDAKSFILQVYHRRINKMAIKCANEYLGAK